jgi:6-phosphogluconolactonase
MFPITIPVDERRNLVVFHSAAEATAYSVKHFLTHAKQTLNERNWFSVALSGGSTPKQFFEKLVQDSEVLRLDWKNICLFWSDERAVPPDHADSNFKMAMQFFSHKPFSDAKIFRMPAEHEDKERAAKEYEAIIQRYCFDGRFDIVYLGMGDDGHTASLFPNSPALQVTNKLVTSTYVEEKKSWRMTLTYPAINEARNILILAFGPSKATMLQHVLFGQDQKRYPISFVGSQNSPAHFITDQEAARLCMS